MPLATFESVSLAYGHVPLLDRVGFVIESGSRTGLIGRNGTGKSSLLKILVGEAVPDDGRVWRRPQLRIGYVSQEPQLDLEQTVFQATIAGLGEISGLIVEYHAALQALGDGGDAAMARVQRAQEALERRDGWRIEQRVETVLTRLRLPAEARVQSLSGGMRKRVALARALADDPELLVLDEPTNHLDVESIEWLEQTLLDFGGACFFVTHDRTFLDHVATDVAELDRGHLTAYPGNYAEYERRKAQQLAVEATVNQKFDRLLAQEEAWIRKGIEARRTRNEGRVRRLERLREERAQRRNRIGSANLAVAEGERSGQLVAELESVGKAFDGRPVVADFSCRILRGDKIGLIGPNGSGKSTLIKLILGEIEPDSGRIRRGARLSVAYYDQFRTRLEDDATVADTIAPGSDYVEIGGARKHIMTYLADFLFPPERARAPVKALSGGERNRLLLARLFSQAANLLVLDEPTNDLDIDTLELLEELLQDYGGTVLLVSHDRMFLDNVITDFIAPVSGGRWIRNAGGYAEWKRLQQQPGARTEVPAAALAQVPGAKAARAKKLSYKETKELEALPARIEALEREQAEISRKLAGGVIFRDDPAEAARLGQRHATIDEELSACLQRWEDLEKLM